VYIWLIRGALGVVYIEVWLFFVVYTETKVQVRCMVLGSRAVSELYD
jgi:hypothetical protein